MEPKIGDFKPWSKFSAWHNLELNLIRDLLKMKIKTNKQINTKTKLPAVNKRFPPKKMIFVPERMEAHHLK